MQPAHGLCLAGTLPSEWAAMRNLQWLSLSKNMVDGTPRAFLLAFSKSCACVEVCASPNTVKDVPHEAAEATTAGMQ